MEQKTILITGASGRLGTAFARSIAAFGGRVFLVDLDKEKGRRLVAELGAHKADFFVADITTASGIQKSIQSCVVKFGKIDAIVHAAYPRSAGWGATLENLQAEHLFEDLSKQLGGAILLSQQVIHSFSSRRWTPGPHLLHPRCSPKFEHYGEPT